MSAQEFQCELTRDAFIIGITSSFIKQRLLEEDALTLDDAKSKAEILERAQNQSGSLRVKPLQSPVSAACSSQSKTFQNKNGIIFVLEICIPTVERNALLKVATAGVVKKRTFLQSMQIVPNCLALSTIPVQINKMTIYTLLDSGASHSHISLNAVEWLKLKAHNGPITEVALANRMLLLKA